MMIIPSKLLIEAAMSDAAMRMPQESCGVVVSSHRRNLYVPCRNISAKNEHFIIHPEDLAKAEDVGEIIMIVHSHPNTAPQPSQVDMLGIERTKLPWLIVNPRTNQYTVTKPSGYVAPLVGREFAHQVADCYTLILDYYARELNINLPDFERLPEWWLKNHDLYKKHFTSAGFSVVPFNTLKEHDVIIMRMASPVDNHGGVYVGNNHILQHIANHLSSKDVYGGYYRKATTMLLRHQDLM
jgi:proteasome lid subunit RPN8/RPN11